MFRNRPMSAILLAGFGLLMFFSAFLALHIIRGMGSFQLTHFHFN